MSKRSGKTDKMHNECYAARKLIGKKGVTQRRLGELTGISSTVVYRRESGDLGIPSAATTLYRLIIALAKVGMSSEVEDSMESVPASERSEDKALMALTLLCFEKGRLEQVKAILGDTEAQKAQEENKDPLNVESTMRVLAVVRKDLERQAKKNDKFSSQYRDAAKTFKGAEYELQLIKEMLEEEREKSSESESKEDT